MALGQLIVRLGLDAADFVSGLERSEVEAKRFARNFERGVVDGAKNAALALGVMAAAGAAAFKFLESQANEIAKFKQLSEEIGDTAEAIAGLQSAAATSGVAIDTVAAASVKLTAALSKTDDEGKGAGLAIKALGLNLEEFKRLSPVAQLETLAKSFGKFEDGANKTAAAVLLFGRTGASILPFLNDLDDAGGRNVRLTQAQIEAADRFTKQLAALKDEISLAAQQLAGPFISALSDVIKQFQDASVASGSFLGALRAMANSGLAFEGPIQAVDRLRGELAKLEKLRDQPRTEFLGFSFGPDIVNLESNIKSLTEALKVAEAAKARMFKTDSRQNADRAVLGQRPALPPLPQAGARSGGRAAIDRETEAERYVKSLEKQLERTQELTVAEQALLDITLGRLGPASQAVKDQVLALAQQIDAANAAKRAAEEQRKADDEASRLRERASQEATRAIENARREAQSISDSNEQLREQVIFLRGGQEALDAYTLSKLAKAAAEKEDQAAMLANAGASADLVEAIRAQAAALRERASLIGDVKLAETLAEEARQLQQFKNLFSDTFADAFSDFINGTKSAKDAFKDFERSIVSSINRLIAQNLAEKLFGGKSSGGFDIGKIFSSLFSGFGSGGGFPAFATGGNPPVGVPSIVGERGPELFVPKSAGTIVPNGSFGGTRIVQNINVMPGANTQSARQAALAAGDAVRLATMRR